MSNEDTKGILDLRTPLTDDHESKKGKTRAEFIWQRDYKGELPLPFHHGDDGGDKSRNLKWALMKADIDSFSGASLGFTFTLKTQNQNTKYSGLYLFAEIDRFIRKIFEEGHPVGLLALEESVIQAYFQILGGDKETEFKNGDGLRVFINDDKQIEDYELLK